MPTDAIQCKPLYMKPSVKRRKKAAEAARRRRKRARMEAGLISTAPTRAPGGTGRE